MTLRFCAALLVAGSLVGCGGSSGSDSSDGSEGASAAVQEPGTYLYATRGVDRVQTFVSGRHRYPA